MIRQLRTDLFPFMVGTRRSVVRLLTASFIGGLAEAAGLVITVRVALTLNDSSSDEISLPLLGDSASSLAALGVAATCSVIALISHVLIARDSAWLSSSVLANARSTAVHRYVQSGWSTQSLQSEGSLQETVSTLSQRSSMLTQALASGVSQGIMLSSFIVAALVVDPVSAAGVVGGGFVVMVLVRPVARATRRTARAFVTANLQYLEEVSRLTSTSMELRVYGVESNAEAVLADLNREAQHKQQRSRFYTMFGSSLYKDVAIIMLIAFIGVLIVSGPGQIAGVGVVITLIVRSLASAQQVNSAYQNVNENVANLDALNERLSALESGREPTGVLPIRRISTIDFKDVTYGYPDAPPALDGLSISLQRGESLGVVGPSGGGKSTMVQVLLRLRPPSSGTVFVNGIDYTELDAREWAQMLGFVPQEPSLLEASLADNIRYYRSISRDEIEAAAVDANVYDEIMRLPAGFDTVLGPRGSGLSGGQKQRVAIARALAGKPELLVMDEPSSALDVKSEQLLQEAMSRLKGRTTMVIVAHRIKTVESCDRLLVLNRGKMAQLGSPSELADLDGFFRDIQDSVP